MTAARADRPVASFPALGTTAVIDAADPEALDAAAGVVRREVEACDRACSRFRPDSELAAVNDPARRSRHVPASAWLCDAVADAVEAAVATDGLVDPTLGRTLIRLGYDRSFETVAPDGPVVVTGTHVPAWQHLSVDRARGRLSVPPGVALDLGATAKARCADRAARAAARLTGAGVLVSLGGDLAVAGDPPAGGWVVRVTDRSDTPPGASVPGQTVAVTTGGLATSGTSARRWTRGGRPVHHLVDPRDGQPADEVWRTATVAAASCTAANVASTAAVVLGEAAPEWLSERGFPARLVRVDGRAVTTGGWPDAGTEVAA